MPHTFRCGAFDCGVKSINDALRGELLTSIREGRSRAYYVEEGGVCLGFISLRAESFELRDSIDREEFVVSGLKVPGVLLELIGTDESARGRGVGRFLLLSALVLARQVADTVGARFLVLDSLPEAVAFYAAKGFRRTVHQPDAATVFMVLDLLE
ncbi:GNAT family N-acetyltransferase [Deinococcus aquaticus]|uniref:GNAT family N-acetyltransferase n=1 Tax=Deinococcus aquaticus TaxID=328692 RepID=A0ABY7UY76_9DEIO|nr:GNAT family N-acetyltransferase [Deinococcus aquaticus]WDA57871.1 GNAT family N-acetyltransferase [Deinococcus aquaticus]